MSFHNPKEITNPPTNSLPAYNASDLTKGGDQAHIVYQNKTYTLRITRAGKLILTK
ncbi:MAG: hemin uptake protein HemP [Roseovarius sp.]|nr:hemin uptake protein HemP [Roseovarius sp.]